MDHDWTPPSGTVPVLRRHLAQAAACLITAVVEAIAIVLVVRGVHVHGWLALAVLFLEVSAAVDVLALIGDASVLARPHAHYEPVEVSVEYVEEPW